MIEQCLRKIITSKDTPVILQSNCHRSPHVMHSLFNQNLTNKFYIIALQEPHINKDDYSPPNQTNWTLISPTPKHKMRRHSQNHAYITGDLQTDLNPITSPSRHIRMHNHNQQFHLINLQYCIYRTNHLHRI